LSSHPDLIWLPNLTKNNRSFGIVIFFNGNFQDIFVITEYKQKLQVLSLPNCTPTTVAVVHTCQPSPTPGPFHLLLPLLAVFFPTWSLSWPSIDLQVSPVWEPLSAQISPSNTLSCITFINGTFYICPILQIYFINCIFIYPLLQ
jgi:hypothetical protein